MNKENLKNLGNLIFKTSPHKFHMGCKEYSPLNHSVKLVAKTDLRKYKRFGHVDHCLFTKDFFNLRDDQWQFLFSALWVKYDPSKEAFINRIKYLLDNFGVLQNDWIKVVKGGSVFYK